MHRYVQKIQRANKFNFEFMRTQPARAQLIFLPVSIAGFPESHLLSMLYILFKSSCPVKAVSLSLQSG